MPIRRRPAPPCSAVGEWLRDDSRPEPARAELGEAVRLTARTLAAIAPGASVEVRVPPFVAVQCVSGPEHRRGNPPNVVETDPRTWLLLATGLLEVADAAATGALQLSGARAGDIAAFRTAGAIAHLSHERGSPTPCALRLRDHRTPKHLKRRCERETCCFPINHNRATSPSLNRSGPRPPDQRLEFAVVSTTNLATKIVSRPTMTACPRAPTIDTAGGPPAGRQKELPMADSDLGAQFEKVSDKAKAATDKLKDATSRTRDQLQSDVAGARDKAVAAADQFKDKADAAQARASSQWQEIVTSGRPMSRP